MRIKVSITVEESNESTTCEVDRDASEGIPEALGDAFADCLLAIHWGGEPLAMATAINRLRVRKAMTSFVEGDEEPLAMMVTGAVALVGAWENDDITKRAESREPVTMERIEEEE